MAQLTDEDLDGLHGRDVRGASPDGRRVWIAAFLSFIVLLTAAGNSLLILLIFTQRSLRNTSNYFLVSLFMSDLMVGLVVMPPAMLNELYGRWVLDSAFCCIWHSFDVMCCSASILNLCVISLDRYLLIISPLKYKLRMTSCRALGLMLATWTLAALASFLPIKMGWHEQNLEAPSSNLTSAAEGKQCRLTVSLPYALIASCLTFFLPSAAISFTYCRILLAARKQAVQVAALTTNMPNATEDHTQVSNGFIRIHQKDVGCKVRKLSQKYRNPNILKAGGRNGQSGPSGLPGISHFCEDRPLFMGPAHFLCATLLTSVYPKS